MNREMAPTLEIHHAKADHDYSVASFDRHFGGDCADGWFAKSIRTTSIGEPGQAIAAAGCTGRPPPAARRSSALGKKPDGSERSSQPGERGARPHYQRHLPRLLNIRSVIRRDKIRRDAEARKTVAQLLEIGPDFRISEWVA